MKITSLPVVMADLVHIDALGVFAGDIVGHAAKPGGERDGRDAVDEIGAAETVVKEPLHDEDRVRLRAGFKRAELYLDGVVPLRHASDDDVSAGDHRVFAPGMRRDFRVPTACVLMKDERDAVVGIVLKTVDLRGLDLDFFFCKIMAHCFAPFFV